MTLNIPKPHPYQDNIINQARESFSKGHKRIILQLPTGGGKSVIAGHITHKTVNNNKRVLVVTHREEIAKQFLKHFYNFGIIAGQVMSKKPMMPNYPVQVSMVGTLVNRIHKLHKPDLILIDESHHSTSPTWAKIMDYFKEVPVIGLTATPQRLDGKGLNSAGFTDMVLGPSIKWLVKNGYLSYPIMYKHPNEITQEFKVKNGDYDTKEQEVVFSKGTVLGDVLEHYKKHLDGLPTVAFCPTVEHSKLTAEMFNQAGYVAKAVYGNMDDKERDKAISGLADGSVQIVTSCDVISEGMDVPGIVGAILLRRTMSLSLFLQQTGRALRLAPGKKAAIILDHAGNYKLHGSVLDDRIWSLGGQKKKDKKLTPKMTECPECYALFSGIVSKCLACGYDFPKIEIPREVPKFTVIKGELEAEFPDLEDGLIDVAARALADDNVNKQKLLWSTAYGLADQGEAGRLKLDKVRKAMGYKANWTNIVWKKVMGENE